MEAFMKGFRCAEVPIEYRLRVGDVKLHSVKDAYGNVMHLFKKRLYAKKKRAEVEIQTLENVNQLEMAE
jgi:hypothetical protein